MNSQDKEVISFILSSKIRTKIVLSLLDQIQAQSDISKEINTNLSSVNRSLKELLKMKIILPIAFSSRRNKLYQINAEMFCDEMMKIIYSIAKSRGLFPFKKI